ncbi:heavy-metal-associated domain-containing protein [Salinibacterium sp. G-O1]|uniref:heavy-metal-associated domain-containing protein n=1 Tax=Salinibacterium sp. G-O1 TaxID=3046208 RepID=UPI0024BBD6D7|nr:heavy-metal-associated domain-containing protein [Salinibacterium sp. G-O1]MDJ0336141.1 heavy-metal-associated domain-containing protein [Salinibacterium sp. G-O1]
MCNSPSVGADLGLTDKNHACNCGHASTPAPAPEAAADAIREHYLVEGMTCSHCVASITEEVSAVDGVDSVSVELNAGGASRIMVVSSAPIEPGAIRDAVTQAGYSLAAG